nr:30S ribosomal protein S20 [Candidatus Dependentiae bacterium]
MANIKSAKKKAKQAIKHRIANAQKKTKLRTYVKKIKNDTNKSKKDETLK